MKAALWAVACMRLLDRRLMPPFKPCDLNTHNTRPDFPLSSEARLTTIVPNDSAKVRNGV
jgi:hypothetical protein